jgi:hypothetical protein
MPIEGRSVTTQLHRLIDRRYEDHGFLGSNAGGEIDVSDSKRFHLQGKKRRIDRSRRSNKQIGVWYAILLQISDMCWRNFINSIAADWGLENGVTMR